MLIQEVLRVKIRQHGVLKAGFTDRKEDIDQLVKHLQQVELPKNEVEIVSTKTPYVSTGKDLSVVLVDFGKKQNIVRELNVRGCNVTVCTIYNYCRRNFSNGSRWRYAINDQVILKL